MIKLIPSKESQSSLFLFYVLAFLALLEYFQIRYIFPITEGWWETYAWILNSGFDIYKDGGLKLSPLFVLLTNLLTNILNFNYFEERVVFVGIRLITVLLTYLWLRRFYGNYESVIGSMIPALLIYGNPVYLTKDYHSLVALFVAIILYILSSTLIRGVGMVSNFYASLLGFFFGLLFLTKQNIGLFLALGSMLYIIKVEFVELSLNFRQFANKILSGIVGLLLPILVISFVTPNWHLIFLNNDSKGSIFTVLFRFLLDKNSLYYLLVSVAMMLACAFWAFLIKEYKSVRIIHEKWFVNFAISLLILTLISTTISPIFLVCLSIAWPLAKLILKDVNISANVNCFYANNMWIILYAYAYCGTNTAGFNYVSVDYLIAFFVAGIIKSISINNWSKSFKFTSLIIISVFLIIPKLMSPTGYNWWGLKSGGIAQSSSELPYKKLAGIYTDSYTAEIFTKIQNYIHLLKNNERFFAYPSIPIFYYLEGQIPIGRPVLWFDVSGSNDGQITVNDLNSKPPGLIFWLKPPRGVYTGHFDLRKSDPTMLYVDKWIVSALKNNKYQIMESMLTFDDNYQYSTKLFKKDIAISLNNNNNNNKLISLCDDIEGCFYDGRNKYEFNTGAGYQKFIELSKIIVETDAHILYVLKLN